MWKNFNEWATFIDKLDVEILKSSREEIYEKTGIWSHAFATLYHVPYESALGKLILAPEKYIKIPLKVMEYPERNKESIYSYSHCFNLAKGGDINIFHTNKFRTGTGAYCVFFSSGGFHSEVDGVPIMTSFVDFGRYLQDEGIKAHLTAAGKFIDFWI